MYCARKEPLTYLICFRDDLWKYLLPETTIEDLIRGDCPQNSFDRFLFLEDDTCDGYSIYESEVELWATAELITSRNNMGDGGFMDELPTIFVNEDGLKAVIDGRLAKDVLTQEEIEQIKELVDCHVSLSIAYADKHFVDEIQDYGTWESLCGKTVTMLDPRTELREYISKHTVLVDDEVG